MKATVKHCRDAFKEGYYAFEDSRIEAREVWDMYHNRQYTSEQLAVLSNRGQPAETFNVIKLFARMLVGYYSTVVNTAVARARHPRDVTTATVLNDTIQYTFEQNRFDLEGDEIKLGGLISGLMCCSTNIKDSGAKDEFGRSIHDIDTRHVPDYQIVLDANSMEHDYSDGMYLHRFKWMPETELARMFGKDAAKSLNPQYNHLAVDEAEYTYAEETYKGDNYSSSSSYSGYSGEFRVDDNYLVVHTVLVDDQDRRWSMFWCDDKLLAKKEITYRKVKWPYRVQKLHSSNKKEYYGIFREIIQSQKAINQALIQIQLMANTTKVFVEDEAVDNIEDFKIAVNRVNGVIPVRSLSGIRLEQMSRELLDQYTLIDKALDRIQRVLGVNDSFLGMAYASDSGRKVKLQQAATIMSLRYITARIESFYTSVALDVGYLAKQFYRANQFLRLTDSMTGDRWVEINKPIEEATGELDEQGQPMYKPVMMEVIDPDTQEHEIDSDGNYLYAPVPEAGTDFEFTDFDIKVESSAYNDEDEKGQLMLESVMSGTIGQMLSQVNPAGFFKISALAMKTMGTKYSPAISKILEDTAMMLSQDPQKEQDASAMAQGSGPATQGPQSSALKLPQNTNEGM
tara:strand:+ start:11713 stop:13590 length:1878 start_codon:yes stop_codon:yes gene_type:complete